MNAQRAFPQSLLQIPTLPKGRGVMSQAQVIRTLEQIVEVAARLPVPAPLHLSLGDHDLPTSLQRILRRYEGLVHLYSGASVSLPNVRPITPPPQSPLRREWLLVIYAPHWQIAFLAAPQDQQQFSILMLREQAAIRQLGCCLEGFEDRFETLETQHDLTAQLVWRLASDFSDVTPIARGLSDMAFYSGLAWLIIHRPDDRWTVVVRAVQRMMRAERVILYRLDLLSQTLIPLQATARAHEVHIYQENAVIRASFSSQMIQTQEDGLTVLAVPIIQGEQVWGVLEVRRGEFFNDDEIVSLSLIAELLRLSLTIPVDEAPALPAAPELHLPPLAEPEPPPSQPAANAPVPSALMLPAVSETAPYDAEADLYWPELSEFERATSTLEALAVDLSGSVYVDSPTALSPELDFLGAQPILKADPPMRRHKLEPPTPSAADSGAALSSSSQPIGARFDLDQLSVYDDAWTPTAPLHLSPMRAAQEIPSALLSEAASPPPQALKSEPASARLDFNFSALQLGAEPLESLAVPPSSAEGQSAWLELEQFSQRPIELDAPEDLSAAPLEESGEEVDFNYPLEAELATERNYRQELEQHVQELQAQLSGINQQLAEAQERVFALETELKLEQMGARRQAEEFQAQLAQLQAAYEEAQAELAAVQSEYAQLQVAYEEAQAELAAVQSEYAQLQAAHEEARAELADLQARSRQPRLISANSLVLFRDLRGYFDRLRDRLSRLKSSVSVAQVKLLDQIISESGTISTILSEVEQVSCSSSEGLQVLDLVAVLHQALTGVTLKTAQKGFTMPIDAPAQVLIYGHPTGMVRALYNLLMSIVYLSDGSGAQASISLEDAPRLTLRFTPRPEFAAKLNDYLQHFDHGKPHLSALALAREIIQHSGGTLSVQTEGARFALAAAFLGA
jgi:predicted  nucleic acid-binding Zn-ribbon protein